MHRSLSVSVSLLLGLLLVCACQANGSKDCSCYRPPARTPTRRVLSPTPAETLRAEDLPTAWDWRRAGKDGVQNFVTNARNQNSFDRLCGSCWAFGTMGALSDRFLIAAKGSIPAVELAPQTLLDCGSEVTDAGTCLGGSYELAYEFVSEYGAVDETCAPYLAADYSMWGETDCSERMCRDCDLDGTCSFVTNYTRYEIDEYGSVFGEDEMMKEIYARGSIACAIYSHSDAFRNYEGGVIKDSTQYDTITHIISIYGWGTDTDGTDYWIGRNSWGTRWGEHGMFRMERGSNTLNMEANECWWATPSRKTVANLMHLYYEDA